MSQDHLSIDTEHRIGFQPSDRVGRKLAQLAAASIWVIVAPQLACSLVTRNAASRSVSIRPAQDTAWMTERNGGSFEIPIVLQNASNDTLYTQWCGVKAERLVHGAWQKVYTQDCLAISSPTMVLPGHSVSLTFYIVGAVNTLATPKIAPRLTSGVYRVVVPLWRGDRRYGQVSLPETQCRSSDFIVAIKSAV
jgi:hypothetical protein